MSLHTDKAESAKNPHCPIEMLSHAEAKRVAEVRKTLIDEAYHVGIGNQDNTHGPVIVANEIKDAKAIAGNGSLLGTIVAEQLARDLAADEGTTGAGLGHSAISGKSVEPHIHIERSARDIDPAQLPFYSTCMTISAIGLGATTEDAAHAAEIAETMRVRQEQWTEEKCKFQKEKAEEDALLQKNLKGREQETSFWGRLFS